MNLADVLRITSSVEWYITCPVCKNRTCEPGEYVEIHKVSPDRCFVCGWQESNGTEAYPDESDFLSKCWELQVAPYSQLDLDGIG